MSPVNLKDPLLRHSLLLMAASQVGNICNALFHVVMGRWLAPTEYGILVSMLGLILIAGMPLNALSNALAFFSAHLLQEQRAGDILPLVWNWAWKMALIAIGIFWAAWLARDSLTLFFQLPNSGVFFWALLVLALSFLPPIMGGALQGVQAFGWASIAGASWGLVRLLAGGWFVYAIAATAHWALAGQGLAVLVNLGLGLWGLILVLRGRLAPAQGLPSGARTYLLQTLLVLAGFAFLMNADVLIVKHYFAPLESGLYARASTIGRMIIFLPMPIAGALFPKTVSHGASSHQHLEMLRRALLYAGLLVGAAALICSLFPQLPLGLLYHDWAPEAEMRRLVRGVIWAMSPLSLAYILMTFELSQNRFRILAPLALCVGAYLAGVILWHAALLQIVAVLMLVGTFLLIFLFLALHRNQPQQILSANA